MLSVLLSGNDVTRLYIDGVKSARRAYRLGRQEALEELKGQIVEEARKGSGLLRADHVVYFIHQAIQRLKSEANEDRREPSVSSSTLADPPRTPPPDRKRGHETEDPESDASKRLRSQQQGAPPLSFSFTSAVGQQPATPPFSQSSAPRDGNPGFPFAAPSSSNPFLFTGPQGAPHDVPMTSQPDFVFGAPPSAFPHPPPPSISFCFSYSPTGQPTQ